MEIQNYCSINQRDIIPRKYWSSPILQFYENGKLNFGKYLNSDLYKERQRLKKKKIISLIVSSQNKKIEQEIINLVNSKEYKNVRATDYAIKKAHTISHEFKKLTNKIDNYEFGFFLFSDGKLGKEVISDVYLPNSQVVFPALCTVRDYRMAKRFAQQNNSKIIGWAHSHSDMGTFLSGQDKETLENLVVNLEGVIKEEVDHHGELPTDKIMISPTIVINNRGEEYAALQLGYRIYKEPSSPDGPIRIRNVNRLIPNIGIEKIKIKSKEIDKAEIRNNLLYGYNEEGGIILSKGGNKVRLSSLIGKEPQKTTKDYSIERIMQSYNRLKEKYNKLKQEINNLNKPRTALEGKMARYE